MNTKVAVIQAAPKVFDLTQTLGKVSNRAREAQETGAELVVFPEAFIGGYPKGADFGARVGMRSDEGRAEFQRYYESAIGVPGKETALLEELTTELGIHMLIGVIERDGGTLYCTSLLIGPNAGLIVRHRKVMPTAMERLIWGFGDGTDITVSDTAVGRIGAAICWENYMPMLRMRLYKQNVQIYCAPTVDDRDIWLTSMRHIACEGRCFVLSACQFATRADYPEHYKCTQGDDPNTIMIRGGSAIINPFGTVIAGPVYDKPTILTAALDLGQIARGKYDLDVVGHYPRPDIFDE